MSEIDAEFEALTEALEDDDQDTIPTGHGLLDAIAEAIDDYVITPSVEARDALVLWTVATHAQTAWNNATRAAISSPEKRCGKSRLLEVLFGL